MKSFLKYSFLSFCLFASVQLHAQEGAVPDAVEYQALVDFYNATDGANWTNNSNWLNGTTNADFGNWYGVTVENGDVKNIALIDNNLNGTLPFGLGNLDQMTVLLLSSNSGSSTPNLLSGNIPEEIGNISNLSGLYLNNNAFSGDVPFSLVGLDGLFAIDISNNQFNSFPDFSTSSATISSVNIKSNKLDFGDLESNFSAAGQPLFTTFTYSPQAEIGEEQIISVNLGDILEIPFTTPGIHNNYQWYKKDGSGNWQAIAGATSSTYSKSNFQASDAGEYRLEVTNDWVTNLTLYSKPITVYEADCGVVPDALEYQALVDLYNATGGANWANNTNWLQGTTCTDFANWYGVTVENGDVTKIELHGNNLIGELSSISSFANLSKLQILKLYNNELGGAVPTYFGAYTDLIELYISNNSFTGGIPVELGNLTKLKILNAYSNQLSGTIPAIIYQMSNLEAIVLNDNNLNGTISSDISNLVNLSSLALSNNNFSGTLPTEIGSLTKLLHLTVVNNEFEGILPTSLSNLTSIINIHLSNNNFSGEVPDFSGLANVQQILLNANNFEGDISNEFYNLNSLTSLWLHDNNFTGEFPDYIKNYSKLTQLIIWKNNFTSLPQIVNSNLTLQTQDNNLHFGHLEPYFSASGVHDLKTFTYSPQGEIGEEQIISVNLGDLLEIPFTTPGTHNNYQWYKKDGSGNWQAIAGATNATYSKSNFQVADAGEYRIEVTNDWVTGLTLYSKTISVYEADCGEVPDAVEYQALVDFYNATDGANWTNNTNWLQGTTCTDFTNWYGVTVENGDVTGITFTSNDLNGQLPESIGNLRKLKKLTLNNMRNVTGAIPTSIGVLKDLQTLSLTYCGFSGAIPAEIGDIPGLLVLSLTDNNFTTIPLELYGLSTLKKLHLDANNFTGTVPFQIGNLSVMEELFLSNNSFVSPIPQELYGLTSLIKLHIDHNSFAEPFNSSFGGLTNLKVLKLNNNNFSGQVPVALGNLLLLEQLDLGWNQLVGNLPPELFGLTNIVTLNLPHNNLSGTIPASISNYGALQNINLEFNAFEGDFPDNITSPSLKNFTIASNGFTGIPNFVGHSNSSNLSVIAGTNALDFGDLEVHFTNAGQHIFNQHYYSPQAEIGTEQTIYGQVGGSAQLPMITGGNRNFYQWQKKDASNNWINISEAENITRDESTLVFNQIVSDDFGDYRVVVTNEWVTGLTLYSKTITMVESSGGCLGLSLSSAKHVSCYGGNDAEITASVSSSDGPFVYELYYNGTFGLTKLGEVSSSLTTFTFKLGNASLNQPGAEDFGIPATASGEDYEVWVSNVDCGTVEKISVTITEPASLVVSAATIDDNDNGTGSIDLIVSGGTAPYTYSWSGGLPVQEDHIGTVQAGTYNVTVTDANGCSAYLDNIVVEQEGCSFNISASTTPDDGSGNGTIDITVDGTTGPYTYAWSGGLPAQEDQTGLGEGTYRVRVTDSEGCSEDLYVVLSNDCPGINSYFYFKRNVSCHGDSDGRIVFGVFGTHSYDFELYDVNTEQEITNSVSIETPYSNYVVFSGLPASEYMIAIVYGDCRFYTLFEYGGISISEPPALSATASTTADAGTGNGSIDLTVAGGVAPYTYTWTGGLPAQQDHLGTVPAGVYNVLITDALQCTYAVEDILVENGVNCSPGHPQQFTLKLFSKNSVICDDGSSTGKITVLMDFVNPPPFSGVSYTFRLYKQAETVNGYIHQGAELVQEHPGIVINNNKFTFTFDNVPPFESGYVATVQATGVNPPQNETCLYGTFGFVKNIGLTPAPMPNASFTINEPLIESGEYLQATPVAPVSGYTYSYNWNDGDVTTNTIGAAKHRYRKAGDYTITLTVTSDMGCVSQSTKSLRVYAPICESPIPNNGGRFYVDEKTGKIVFRKANCPGNFVLSCASATAQPNIFDNAVAASATTYCDEWDQSESSSQFPAGANKFETGELGKWRVKSSYAYNTELLPGDMNYEAGRFKVEDFSYRYEDSNNPQRWVKVSTVEKYSLHGEALQERNALGIPSTAKFGYDEALPYLTAQNAEYDNVFFESFEKVYSGSKLEEGTFSGAEISITSARYHAGKQAAELITGYKLRSFRLTPQMVDKGLLVKFWLFSESTGSVNIAVKNSNGIQTGTFIPSQVARTGQWRLYEVKITAFAGMKVSDIPELSDKFTLYINKAGTGQVWIDDVRVQPADALMTSYVYDPKNLRLLTVFDDQHFGLYYQYNAEGKLIRKQIETERGLKTLQETQYNVPKVSK
ncbi:PKD domain-containing protein [Fulvivirga ulvae]|uniref:PKD domain-containing protein n=1 Tax=Fulvivirga ulvae TaxID=2904245 RepID=UPI001F323F9C|nr:PKD domain-containing protein [Fulvivirga ulvae]UII30387.1 PKD domain-containing protein [Fulvivirga ulvae]